MRGLVLALYLASPAVAGDCPVAADMTDGIRFSANGGRDVEEQRRLPDGNVATLYTGGEGTWRAVVQGGLYTIESAAVVDGRDDPESLTRTAYELPKEGFPDPLRAGTVMLSMLQSTYTGTSPMSVRVLFGPPMDSRIGDCRYTAIPVDFLYSDYDPDWHELRLLLPELGTSIGIVAGEIGNEFHYELDGIARIGGAGTGVRPKQRHSP